LQKIFENRCAKLLIIFVAAQKLITLDRRHNAHGGVIAWFRTLNSAKTTDANWSR
jgi:hypothetical protein